MKLGVSLLNRTTRQLSLTEEGERYFRRVQSILQEMAAAESEIMETRNTPRGLLRIDAATPVVLHFLMPLIKPFRERYPEVTLSLVSSETIINLIERKVDVAIPAYVPGRYLTVIEKLSPPPIIFPATGSQKRSTI